MSDEQVKLGQVKPKQSKLKQAELGSAGPPSEEAGQLEALARELEQLPPAQPRKSWLAESKWRMQRRFDELRARRQGSPPKPPSD